MYCEYCGMGKWFIELHSHYSSCSKYPINCRYECGITELQRRHKREHFKICGKQEVECKYGCEGKLKRKDVKKHYQDRKDLHLSFVSELKKEIAELKKENAQCARKRDSDGDEEKFIVSIQLPDMTKRNSPPNDSSEAQRLWGSIGELLS